MTEDIDKIDTKFRLKKNMLLFLNAVAHNADFTKEAVRN